MDKEIEGEPKAKPEEMLSEEEREQNTSTESTHNVETPQRKTFWQLYSQEINVILHSEELDQEKAKKIAELKLRYFFDVLLKKPRGERFFRHGSHQEKVSLLHRSVLFNILNGGLLSPATKTRRPVLGDAELTFMFKDPIEQIGTSLWKGYGSPHEKVGYNYTFIIDPSIEVSEPYPREFTRDHISPQEIISVVFRARNIEEFEQLRRNLRKQGIFRLFDGQPNKAVPLLAINHRKFKESDPNIYHITNVIYPTDQDMTKEPNEH